MSSAYLRLLIFLPGCCSPWGRKEWDMTERLNINSEACGILASQPGIEPTSPALEVKSKPLDYQGSPGHQFRNDFCPLLFVVQSLSCVWLFAPRGLQHARLPCPSLFPGVCTNSCPLSWWCHPTILSSDTPFRSCPQISSSFRVFSIVSAFYLRWPKYWSFSFSISPSNEYSGLIFFWID